MSPAALVVGATSGIGTAFARLLASHGLDLVLAGRDPEELARRASDLSIRFGIRAHTVVFDARNFASHASVVETSLAHAQGQLEGVVLCQGEMPDPDAMAINLEIARDAIEVNFSAAVSLLERLAPAFESQGSGWICAITSVAGDRGRPSNYVYGATKAALSTYLEGLRARLGRSGIHVVDVRPGFVDTGLTWGRPGLFLVASAERVAEDSWRGVRRNRRVVYTPWFWSWIMRIVRWMPDRIFNRLDL